MPLIGEYPIINKPVRWPLPPVVPGRSYSRPGSYLSPKGVYLSQPKVVYRTVYQGARDFSLALLYRRPLLTSIRRSNLTRVPYNVTQYTRSVLVDGSYHPLAVSRSVNRLPMLGLRSQASKLSGRQMSLSQSQFRIPARVPSFNTTCVKRGSRRRMLFASGVAGRGRRNSPGKKGHYRLSSTYYETCR